ncbi:hypothetical protein IU510_21085 [Nocardia cyriacigeorgica]|uniref:hypothetical protein n=1 Tax=Nocardia TaxID=1817 RepID=UPI0018942CEA|nr:MULTISPECIES: hypothetical protein [Nocardia]MBF6100556.1 hypothetical protein [Nocardia cyriacigeorgica]
MATPTGLQAHLLRGIQNLALDNERHRARLAGAGMSVQAGEQLEIGQRSLTQLEQVALGVGVPKPWIDYVRAAGQRGMRWTPGQSLLGSGHVEREHLLSVLGREVRGLQDMAGVGAIYIGRGGLDADVVARFRRVMGMTWQRLGAISHALALSTEEQHQVWRRGDRHWSTTVAAQFASSDPKSLAQRWNRVVATDFSAATIPVVVLQAAGITAEDSAAAMPASPDRMVAQVTDALTTTEHPRTTSRSLPRAAIEIQTAVDAANIGPDPEPGDRNPPLPEHSSAVPELDLSEGADR